MPTIDVECPECATALPIEEDRLGTEVKCSKCKFVFEAHKPEAEDEYGLAEPAPSPRPTQKPDRRPSASPTLKAETESEKQLRERMEKWAEEM